jgi:hypothetical protein
VERLTGELSVQFPAGPLVDRANYRVLAREVMNRAGGASMRWLRDDYKVTQAQPGSAAHVLPSEKPCARVVPITDLRMQFARQALALQVCW